MNVSNRINSFQMRPIDGSVAQFFTVNIAPPGHISAGISVPATIIFSPQINRDLSFNLVFDAEFGGEFAVPVRCMRRLALLTVTPSLCFGGQKNQKDSFDADKALNVHKSVVDASTKNHQAATMKTKFLEQMRINEPRALEFEPVMLGGIGKAFIELHNDGAL